MTKDAPVSYRLEELVERSYSAYVSAQSGVDRSGHRHQPWQALSAEEKAGWMAAINTALMVAEGKKIIDAQAVRQAELRGELSENERPGGTPEPIVDEEEETANTAKSGKSSKDDSHATSKKAHAGSR